MNETVRKWTADGTVSLWRYKRNPRNYWGCHLAADAAGGRSLVRLFDLLLACDYSAEVRIPLPGPDRDVIRGVNAPREPVALVGLIFSYAPMKRAADHWLLAETDRRVRLEVGPVPLREMREIVAACLADRAVGGDDWPLWFW